MKYLGVICLLLVLAGSAYADRITLIDGVNCTITATPIGQGADGGIATVTAYSNMVLPGQNGSNYVVTTNNPANYVALDDYAGVSAGPLETFRFVGGVATGSTDLIAGFDFFDTSLTFYNGFGVQFPQTGYFIWTITIGNPASLPVLQNGYVGMWGNSAGTIAGWFLNSALPTVGTTTPYPGYTEPGTGLPMNFKFELNVTPEPASLALLAAGLLLALRRR